MLRQLGFSLSNSSINAHSIWRILSIPLLFLLCSTLEAETTSKDQPNLIRLGTTTSIVNSGLLDTVIAGFKTIHPTEFKVFAVGSGKALKMARSGLVDLVWVHSPRAENKFLAAGYGLSKTETMRSDLVIAGPSNDPAKLAQAANVIEAFQLIAEHNVDFVSRADDSGTHKHEQLLLAKANIDPYGQSWYIESGAGMSKTLALAEKMNAYLLIDRATLTVKKKTNFRVLVEDHKHLKVIYNLIPVNPDKFDYINTEGSKKFITWVASTEGQKLITSFNHKGITPYAPPQKTP